MLWKQWHSQHEKSEETIPKGLFTTINRVLGEHNKGLDSLPELVTASKGKGAGRASSGFKLHTHQNLGLPLGLLLWGRTGAFVFLTKSLAMERENRVCTPPNMLFQILITFSWLILGDKRLRKDLGPLPYLPTGI